MYSFTFIVFRFFFQCTPTNAENIKTEMIILKLHVRKYYACTNRLTLTS